MFNTPRHIHSSLWRCAAVRRSPRKIEKRPIYVINVFIAPEDVDNYIEPTKNVVHLRVSPSSETLFVKGNLTSSVRIKLASSPFSLQYLSVF